MTPPAAERTTPWHIHFFQRDRRDDADKPVPAIEFFDGLPPKVAAEIHAVLGDMAGYYEVRVQGGGMNHRLFCVLERDAEDLGGSSIVCIDGLSKPRRTAADSRDYRRVKRYGAEFQKRRTVLE